MASFELIVVPDESEADAALLFVEAVVAGRPYRFLLDTGAARTLIRNDAFLAGFPSRSLTDAGSGIFGGNEAAETIVVPRFTLGPIERENFAITRIAAESPAAGNLIGMDLLSNRRCDFRLDASRIEIDPNGTPAGLELRKLVVDAAGHPYVEIAFGDAVANACWDTGASVTIVDLAFVARHPGWFREIGRSRGTDAGGNTMETPALLMTGAVIGGWAVPPHEVAGVDLSAINARIDRPMDAIIGYRTYARANWWMDFPARRWATTRLND